MSRVYLVELESVSTRYTGQWQSHIPQLLRDQGHDVQVISGPGDIPAATTPGAFLNFGGTNVYKSVQVETISRLFCSGSVPAHSHFVFYDAWHPGIINLKYMSELLGIPVKIHALWHAGSYDPQDFLGRLIGSAPWVRHAEKSFFWAIDHNYFATDFHIELFCEELLGCIVGLRENHENRKIVRSGWPMEYLSDTLEPYKNQPKRDLILFPHRIAPEKQVEIFRDLSEQLPQYDFVVCQDRELSKHEYHTLLAQAKIVFSASLQETLGISLYEGCLVNALPMAPDRLSYTEMYFDQFKYPSAWTENWSNYIKHRQELCWRIMQYMSNYEHHKHKLKEQTEQLSTQFFTCTNLLNNLK
jgi:hypothetical protein